MGGLRFMSAQAVGILVLVVVMLVTGSVNTLSKKWQNQQTSHGLSGEDKPFSFPWTQTLFMFAGEALCAIVYVLMRVYQTKCRPAGYENRYQRISIEEKDEDDDDHKHNPSRLAINVTTADDEPAPAQQDPWYAPFYFLLTCCFDVIGTTLGGIGLLYTYASVFQMLRGSIIVFSGILSVLFLKRKLYFYNWLGITITTVGLACVGIASVISDSGGRDIKEVILGDVLIILGQLSNAIQMIIEEIFLKRQNYHALVVVGGEGLWGVLLMAVAVLPICYLIPGSDGGSYENAVDGFVMIGNNMTLLGLVLLYWLSIAFYNFTSLSVAKSLTTVHRTFIDACRTLCVWGIQLVIYYAFNHTSLGEGWGHYSYIQLIGFVLLISGTLVYNSVVKLPFLYYPTKEDRH
ncbi:uncharacterized protein ACA1_088940 [Acanthamoeba castellanii str. Neff]|uniref:Solute carrier family 35 member F6 n=1 Tax=Acanthamoeba castellanii (strain ATCC 30010 / Neff) TaxID=1257118 RepID=L8GUQ2_ACACF|nr:uncharacterized protein ACA1_088940 [Acanthamoeba castellanii str. Neff]ELR16647.1 hypothetical protein ACA1_088940 [Acanthamoeba castellanii str. Neff]